MFAFLWVPLVPLVLRFGFGYRVAELREVRRRASQIRAQSDGPLLLCANHLTLIDSILVAWALRNPVAYLGDPDTLPWNTPETRNFAASPGTRVLSYLTKCIPITRGGRREDTGGVLNRVSYLLSSGETALIFPEGGRSRSGRVTAESAAWGVGRIIGALPGCQVMCVYLRGEGQESWSSLPRRGERFRVGLACIEPKSDHRGARRSRDLAQQVTQKLIQLEAEHFDGRE